MFGVNPHQLKVKHQSASLIVSAFILLLTFVFYEEYHHTVGWSNLVGSDYPKVTPEKLGANVWGIFVASSDVGPRGSLLVWNGSAWNEDLYYHQHLNLPGADSAFYRPFSFSSTAYEITVASEQWSRVSAEGQFAKKFENQALGTISVIQLDYPNGPFVYLEMVGKDDLRVLRLPTPQDESLATEAWLRDASISGGDGAFLLSLTFETYNTGSGRPSDTLSVNYRSKGDSWEMLSVSP